MAQLAKKLRLTDYFSLGWGTMVGVGWLVVMDDWLLRGGSLGGVLGFAIGGLLLLPIGYVYGKLVTIMPDASGEVAYTAKVFPQTVSYATGWMMMLAYFIVCPLGGCCRRPHRRIHFSRAQFHRALPNRRKARLPSSSRDRPRSHPPAHRSQLSRYPPERNLSELDYIRHARHSSSCSFSAVLPKARPQIFLRFSRTLLSFRLFSSCKSFRTS
jgi:hypothetical protein